jgi:hypothetical protein
MAAVVAAVVSRDRCRRASRSSGPHILSEQYKPVPVLVDSILCLRSDFHFPVDGVDFDLEPDD